MNRPSRLIVERPAQIQADHLRGHERGQVAPGHAFLFGRFDYSVQRNEVDLFQAVEVAAPAEVT